ncbi:MAG TPA: thiamine-phosphate kinase [Candidatus Omnitrophota bacterium]|nr:thiamine-phosphate kinase [Candidatus Omnitrophota bacterium]
MNEFSFIEYLKKTIRVPNRIPVGIGDDAAVLNIEKGKQLVVSTDAIVENVDFILKTSGRCLSLPAKRSNLRDRHAPKGLAMTALSPEKIGRKALAINLSDMAAMGAKPTAFVITIGKPSYITSRWLARFYKGLLKLAKQYRVSCVGGDFSRSKEFFANVTILGEVSSHHVVTRSGAMVGDWIAVTGTLGGSLLHHHYDFTPRISEGLFLAQHFTPTAMIDISDGLCQDLSHILKASGVGARLDLERIPVSADSKKMSHGNAKKALTRALSDGEDFELLMTVPPWQKMMLEKSWKKKFPSTPLTWIGKIEGKKPLIHWHFNQQPVPGPQLSQKGYAHF